MRPRTLALATLLAGLSWGIAVSAQAQRLPPSAARQFAELARQNLFGEELIVTSTRGVVLRGTVVDIDVEREILTLRSDTIDFRLSAGGIRTVERRVRDSVRNGALIGAAAGVVFGVLLAAGEDGIGAAPKVSLLTAPLGAAIGIAVDFVYHAPETIYRGSPVAMHAGAARGRAVTLRLVW